mmetsp:Transcript_13807/g.23503  ORF Transcript_13807/g.23503 Transcript_13807/m.23503 type:complete len:106 (-) Transcript_13807:1805-2122(-)
MLTWTSARLGFHLLGKIFTGDAILPFTFPPATTTLSISATIELIAETSSTPTNNHSTTLTRGERNATTKGSCVVPAAQDGTAYRNSDVYCIHHTAVMFGLTDLGH